MMIVMVILVALLLAFFSYQLYVRVQLESLDSDNPKMKRKINFYKHQENNRSLIFLMAGTVMFSLLFAGVFYNQNVLRQETKDLELKVEEIKSSGAGSSSITVESYKENALKLTEFPWNKVVESRDATALTNYEIQLSRDWQPFFGEINATILKSNNTKSLTLSIFSSSLRDQGFETAEKNVEVFAKELAPIKEITMLDFNFTYRDKTNTLSKKAIVYSRPSKEGNLEKIELEK
ncbi:hypothetical protein BCR26_00120 [Enterococcus rivorum]|uniref:Uncharacterized protein n=2 Tax=Enterococcus rivorum TaxID=762845 RepID=A0A1E5L1Z6_9ENTE|nr:hypothetical protein BCR26_00120 [Enterococcus rivorum]